MGDTPCFLGDRPDLERYYGQLKAFHERKDFQHFQLILIGEDYYFVSNHPCEGDTCLIREYTTFVLDNIKVDIWIIMEGEAQLARSDELLHLVKLVE